MTHDELTADYGAPGTAYHAPLPPADRAERALLGAALLDSRRVAGAADWLLPLDFRAPAHARLWAAMLNNPPTADSDRYPMQLLQAMARTGQPPAFDGPGLHSLMESCPHPHHAPFYAAMVAEASAHRMLDTYGQHLTHIAGKDGPLLDVVEDALAEAGFVHERIDAVRARWHRVPESMRDRIDRTTGAHLPPEQAWPQAPEPRRDHADPQAEAAVLGAVIASPDAAAALSWLSPHDFAGPGHAEIWDTVRAMRDRTDPVDAMTVTWELQRADPALRPALDHLDAITRDGHIHAAYAESTALDVAAAAALDRIDLAGRRLQTLATGYQVPPTPLLDTANRVVEHLPREAERLGPRLPARVREPERPRVELLPPPLPEAAVHAPTPGLRREVAQITAGPDQEPHLFGTAHTHQPAELELEP